MSASFLPRVLIAAAVALLIAGGVWWISRPPPVAVVVSEIGRGLVESTIANTRAGTVEACQRTRLSTISGGRIEVLAVKEGDRVRAGQLLMKLWNDDQKAQGALAMAQVATARQRVAEAHAQPRHHAEEAGHQRDFRDPPAARGQHARHQPGQHGAAAQQDREEQQPPGSHA